MIIRLPLSKCILSCILSCFLLLSFPPSVYAEGEEVDSFLDPDGLQTMLNRYFEEKDILSDLVSVGYVYTETGETWYHNPDCWYYSASLYKVPLMMLLAVILTHLLIALNSSLTCSRGNSCLNDIDMERR